METLNSCFNNRQEMLHGNQKYLNKKVIGKAKTCNPLDRTQVLNWLRYLGTWRYWKNKFIFDLQTGDEALNWLSYFGRWKFRNNKFKFELQTGDVAWKSKVFDQKSHRWGLKLQLLRQNSNAKLTELPWQMNILKQTAFYQWLPKVSMPFYRCQNTVCLFT